MAEDKQRESLLALKNANKHLTDLFARMEEKNRTMAAIASELERLAPKMGELQAETYHENRFQQRPLSNTLMDMASRLNKVRS